VFDRTSVIIAFSYFVIQAVLVSRWLNPIAWLVTEILKEISVLISTIWPSPFSGILKANLALIRYCVHIPTYCMCNYQLVCLFMWQFQLPIFPLLQCLICYISIFIVVHNRNAVKAVLPHLFPFRAVQFIQLVNLRVSRDTLKLELYSYYLCKCTFHSAETGWKEGT
jgi:hypothetical protein